MLTLNKNGYTIVKSILKDTELILNGTITYNKRLSKSRTITKMWKGVENIEDMHHIKFNKRIDISLPYELSSIFAPDVYKWIRYNMKGYKINHCNLLITESGAPNQEYHQDKGDIKENDSYYTLFIPLTDYVGMGKTELILPFTQEKRQFPKQPQSLIPDVKVGDALIFSGSMWHRGTINNSKYTRYCLYFVLTKEDVKTDESWLI